MYRFNAKQITELRLTANLNLVSLPLQNHFPLKRNRIKNPDE